MAACYIPRGCGEYLHLNPEATQRMRNATAALAVAWAVLALVLSLAAKLEIGRSPVPPLSPLGVGGGFWLVEWASPEAQAAGVQSGDRIVALAASPSIHARSPTPRFSGPLSIMPSALSVTARGAATT